MVLFSSLGASFNKFPVPFLFAPRFKSRIRLILLAKGQNFLFVCILSLLFSIFSFSLSTAGDNSLETSKENQVWVHIPPGAKSTYMGIHGGTMPVSLLVAQDGSALLSFVGKTGNDFINALTKGKFAWPRTSNSTQPELQTGRTQLFAGNATASLPVFTGAAVGEEWLKNLPPFGFSVSPLVIEGQPDFPEISPAIRKYRNFYLQGSLPRNK